MGFYPSRGPAALAGARPKYKVHARPPDGLLASVVGNAENRRELHCRTYTSAVSDPPCLPFVPQPNPDCGSSHHSYINKHERRFGSNLATRLRNDRPKAGLRLEPKRPVAKIPGRM